MKLKHISFCLAGAFIFLGTSCRKFLDETNPNQVAANKFFNTLGEMNSGLNAAYASLYDNDILGLIDESMRSDIALPSRMFPSGNNLALYTQTFNNVHPYAVNKWSALNKAIFRTNQVLEGLKKVTVDPSDTLKVKTKLQLEAQARLLRGAYLFWTANSFNNGKVVIFDFVPKQPSEYQKSASPREEVLAFVKKDLLFAANSDNRLPAVWPKEEDRGRVTLGTANALLGQFHLYEKNYDSAAVYFKRVIDGPYSLTPTLEELTTGENELSSESIFEINYSRTFKQDKSGYQTGSGGTVSPLAVNLASAGHPGGFRSAMPPYWLIVAYKDEVMDNADPRNFKTVNGVKTKNAYSLRAAASIAVPDDGLMYYQQKTFYAPFNNNEPGYFRKFTNWKFNKTENDDKDNLRRSGINIPIIRLADVYLMYAEALIQGGSGGNVEEALKYVNRVRRRSGLRLLGASGSGEYPGNDHDNVTYTPQSLMNHLMYVERPLELALEGMAMRAIDLRRWGVTKQRFESLSKMKFKRDNFLAVDPDNNNFRRTVWGSIVRYANAAELANPATVFDIDYQAAASNFVESEHAYWPVPAIELTSNPNF